MRVTNAAVTTQEYAEFNFGSARKSAKRLPVSSRAMRDLPIPRGAVTVCFFRLVETTTRVGRQRIRMEHVVDDSCSDLYYLGRVYTRHQIRRVFPRQQHLLSQMRFWDSSRVLRTASGEWVILDRDDQVVDPETRRLSRQLLAV